MPKVALVAFVALAFSLGAFMATSHPGMTDSATDPVREAHNDCLDDAFVCVEIVDALKDVHPAAAAQGLPPESQVAHHMELYDIASADLIETDENGFAYADGFFLRISIADIPDDWILEPGPAGGPAIEPILVSDADGDLLRVKWQDVEGQLNSKVNLTTYFTIKKADGSEVGYRAVAVLAELNLENPNAFPGANTQELFRGLVAEIHDHLTDEGALLDNTALQGAGGTNPKQGIKNLNGKIQANISAAMALLANGPAGSVNALLLEAKNLLNEVNNTADDFVPGPLADALKADIDLIGEKLDTLPLLSMPKKGEFTTEEVDPQSPKVLLFHHFELQDASGRFLADLSGTLSADDEDGIQDFIQMAVPRDEVGDAKKGDRFTKFRVESSFGLKADARKASMDFAPPATNPVPTDPVTGLVTDAATGQLVKPQFADHEYAFVYESSVEEQEFTGGLQLRAVGPTDMEIAPGGSATYVFTLTNVGDKALSGQLSLSEAAAGWTHSLDQFEWSLDGDEATTVVLSASAVEGAASRLDSRATASIAGGTSKAIVFTTRLGEPIVGDGGDQDQQGTDGAGKEGKKKGGKGPGFEAVGVLVALAGLLAVARRRRN